jgi:hypothetical protein
MPISKTGLTDEQYKEIKAIETQSIAAQAEANPAVQARDIPTPGLPTTPTVTQAPSSNLDSLFEQLLSSEAVTSSTTGIEERIGEAMKGTEDARLATEARIGSEFSREKDFATAQLNAGRESQLDSRRGFATNRQGLKLLEESNIKYINDLESRKQEALLSNDANAASQIASLQMNALEFEQNAKQQVYSNLLGLTGIAQQEQANQFSQANQQSQLKIAQDQENRLSGAQTFAEQSALSSIALQYGITTQQGDTLEDVINRAQPFANAQQKAQLAKLQADVRYTNTQIAAATEGINDSNVSDADVEMFAQAARFNPVMLSQIQNIDALGKVFNRINALEKEDAEIITLAGLSEGETLSETQNAIDDNPNITNKGLAKERAAILYAENTPEEAKDKVVEFEKAKGLQGLSQQGIALGYNITTGIAGWIAGTEVPKIKLK